MLYRSIMISFSLFFIIKVKLVVEHYKELGKIGHLIKD